MGFVTWHTRKVEWVRKWLGITNYQLLWIAWLKGLITGGLIIYLLMI